MLSFALGQPDPVSIYPAVRESRTGGSTNVVSQASL